MTREPLAQALGGIAIFDACSAQAVVADNPLADSCNIGLRRARALVAERIAFQIAVQSLGTTIERVDSVALGEL
jgi:hypothetical protein